MKFTVALSLATLLGGVVASPTLHVRQSGCLAPTEPSCKELHDRCVVQGESVLFNPWNNRVCVAAATCYGVANLLTSYACRLGTTGPPLPPYLPALDTSFFPNPTTQQNYIDFYYGTINAAWPSSANVVIGYWSSMISWINTGSSAPYNNLNDWFHWSSFPLAPEPTPTPIPTPSPITTPSTPTITITTEPTLPTIPLGPTGPTGPVPNPNCVPPTDATCADIVNGCLATSIWTHDPWSQKKCIAAAACFGPQTLLKYGTCVTSLGVLSPPLPDPSPNVWASITSDPAADMTPQNFVDLIYSSITSAWPSSPEFVKNTWLPPIQAVTGSVPNISYANFLVWLFM